MCKCQQSQGIGYASSPMMEMKKMIMIIIMMRIMIKNFEEGDSTANFDNWKRIHNVDDNYPAEVPMMMITMVMIIIMRIANHNIPRKGPCV